MAPGGKVRAGVRAPTGTIPGTHPWHPAAPPVLVAEPLPVQSWLAQRESVPASERSAAPAAVTAIALARVMPELVFSVENAVRVCGAFKGSYW